MEVPNENSKKTVDKGTQMESPYENSNKLPLKGNVPAK